MNNTHNSCVHLQCDNVVLRVWLHAKGSSYTNFELSGRCAFHYFATALLWLQTIFCIKNPHRKWHRKCSNVVCVCWCFPLLRAEKTLCVFWVDIKHLPTTGMTDDWQVSHTLRYAEIHTIHVTNRDLGVGLLAQQVEITYITLTEPHIYPPTSKIWPLSKT